MAGVESTFRQCRLFSSLSSEEVQQMQAIAEERDYADGAIIFVEGSMGDSAYLVLDGEVNVIMGTEARKEAVLATLRPGDVVGEMSLLTSNPRSATAMAVGKVKTLRLPKLAFADLLQRDQLVALKVCRNMAATLCQRLLEINRDFTELLARTLSKEPIEPEELDTFRRKLISPFAPPDPH